MSWVAPHANFIKILKYVKLSSSQMFVNALLGNVTFWAQKLPNGSLAVILLKIGQKLLLSPKTAQWLCRLFCSKWVKMTFRPKNCTIALYRLFWSKSAKNDFLGPKSAQWLFGGHFVQNRPKITFWQQKLHKGSFSVILLKIGQKWLFGPKKCTMAFCALFWSKSAVNDLLDPKTA